MALRLLLVIVLWTVPAWGATYYVSMSGNNSNSCGTATDPTDMTKARLTIRNGIACLSAGDTLYIRGGTYPESLSPFASPSVNFPTGTNWTTGAITIASYPGEMATIRPTTSQAASPLNMYHGEVYTTGALIQYLIFDRLTFDAANVGPLSPIGLEAGIKNIRIQNCVLLGSPTSNGLMFGGDPVTGTLSQNSGLEIIGNDISGAGGYGIYGGGRDILLDGNTIHHNAGFAMHLYASDGTNYRSDWIENFTIRNNRMHHNNTAIAGNTSTNGTFYIMGANHLLYNNLIHDNGDGTYLDIPFRLDYCTNCSAYNNTIVNNNTNNSQGIGPCMYIAPNYTGLVQNRIRNNICANNTDNTIYISNPAVATADHNTQTNTPLFAGTIACPYCLSATSPARNAGIAVSGIPAVDILGVARPQPPGGLWDTGAYEFTTEDVTEEPTRGTYYLAPPASGGNDAHTCAQARTGTPSATPKATFASVLPCMLPGSDLLLRAGIYTESLITSVTLIPGGADWANRTRIAAYESAPGVFEAVTLKSGGSNVIVWLDSPSTDHFLTFEGLNLDGDNVADVWALGITAGTHDIEWRSSDIQETPGAGIYLAGSNLHVASTSIHDVGSATVPALYVENVTTASLHHLTVSHAVADAVWLTGSNTGVTLEQSTIRDNTAGSGIVFRGSPGTVQNNLIYSNGLRGITVQTGASAATVYYNTLWANLGAPIQIDSGATGTIYRGNIFAANGNGNAVSDAGTGTVGTQNFAGDPSFVAPGPPITFHVASDSVVGHGPTIASVTVDFAGVPRTVPYTFGAYEDEGVVPTPTIVRVPAYGSTSFFQVQ